MTGRRIAVWGAVVATGLLVLIGLIEYRARSEIRLARESLDQADLGGALKHYSRSLNWYVPWGAAETAAEDLFALGNRLIREGRENDGFKALSRMRAGLYGARSLYVPRMDLIVRAEPVMAELLAQKSSDTPVPPAVIQERSEDYLQLMRQSPRPGVGPAAAATGGFLFWVAAVLIFIRRFFSGGGGNWRRGAPWAMLAAVGFTLWIWGMAWC